MNKSQIRDYLFRGLLFESEAAAFQRAGISVGASSSDAEENLMKEALAPFSISRRNNALEMARLYAVLYCFENEIRDLIRQTLEEKDGPNWFDSLPKRIAERIQDRQRTAQKDSWLEGDKNDPLSFCDFGHLSSIMVAKWEHFEAILPSQHWLQQRMEELEKARNFIAHNRFLLPTEFQRIYMYVADWNRVIGL